MNGARSDTRARVRELLAQGMCNKQIARLTGRDISTVKVHVMNIFRELGVRTRAEASVRLTCQQHGISNGYMG